MDEQLKSLLEGINALKSGQEETKERMENMQRSQEETKERMENMQRSQEETRKGSKKCGKGKKETLEWCMKANLIASRYECPRCKKNMRLQKRKGTVDGYECRCRNQSKDNRHDVVRSILFGPTEKKKHQRQSISLETKIAILDRLGKGEGSTAIGKHFNLGESTVRAIKRNEAAIRKSVISGTKLNTKFASHTRNVLERTERAIAIWIEEEVQRRIPITGESATADEGAVKIFPEELAKIIEDGDYSADQVFNADETGLYLKKLPNRAYITKDEKTASRHKASKDRVILLLCSNASGDRMLKSLLINKSLRPRVHKGKDLKTTARALDG
ncbi:tigger transposable element-derived protein 1 [Trichonephila clavipes]|nr:tigger transposable element-derived protein 1 [Trichonephila clavipes]